MSNIHQFEKKLLTSVTEEGSKGEVEANLRVVTKDKVEETNDQVKGNNCGVDYGPYTLHYKPLMENATF